jgi:transposase
MEIKPHLPNPEVWGCREIILQPKKILLEVYVASPDARCPICGQSSSRVHSRYLRVLADLPWHGTPVQLRVEVRRFFCMTSDCPRYIFVERLDNIARRYARKTVRLADALCSIGFSLGGEAGSRLAGQLGMSTSADTLLNLIRRVPSPRIFAPKVVGLDDWAWRRGLRYGTLLCDLEKHRPIDLLPDRNKDLVSTWLKKHSGIGMISRDRAGDYAKAIKEGAPQAIPVADRWHLIHNLREVVTKILDGHPRELREAAKLPVVSKRPELIPASPVFDPTPPRYRPRIQRNKEERRARRFKRYQEVIELYGRGLSYRKIATHVGLYRTTVAKYVQAGTFPERADRQYRRSTSPVTPFIRHRWAQGCRNAAQITRELKTLGFTGSYWSIRRQVVSWRRNLSSRGPPGSSMTTTLHHPSSKRVAGWFLMDEKELDMECGAFLKNVWATCPPLEQVAGLAHEFKVMVQDRKSQFLKPWIHKALSMTVPSELKRFAQRLKNDKAVIAALEFPWSNGQVEGQINRLKLIKRQMYGRAGFDLLRQRVLHRG